MLKVYLHFLFFLGIGLDSIAQSELRCSSIFKTNLKLESAGASMSSQKLEIWSALDPEKLKQQNFRVSERGLLIDDLKSVPVVLGKIQVEMIQNLYQWAPISERDLQYANKGIPQSEMNSILDADPQHYGRGFYVSKNPVDSVIYGKGLTVFSSSGPVVLLARSNLHSPTFDLDSSVLKRLAKAGIDGLQTSTSNWLSMISVRHLRTTGPSGIKDPFWNYTESAASILSHGGVLDKNDIWDFLPRNNLFNEIQERPSDFTRFLAANADQKTFESLGRPSTQKTKLGKALISSLSDFFSKSDFGALSDSEMINLMYYYFHISPPTNEFRPANEFAKILDYVDPISLSKLFKGVRLSEMKSLDQVIDFVDQMESGRSRVNLDNIHSIETFLSELKKLLSWAPSLREYQVVMGSEEVSRSNKILVSFDIFNKLSTNRLLSVVDLRKKHEASGYVPIVVNYAPYENLLRFVNGSNLVRRFQDFKLNKDENGQKSGALRYSASKYKRLLRDLMELFFTAGGRDALCKAYLGNVPEDTNLKVFALYQIFISLHPLEDGNGRAGRLLFEYLAKVEGAQGLDKLVLPSFDLDLYTGVQVLKGFHAVAQRFKEEANKVRSEQEFRDLVLRFADVFQKAFPNYF